MGPALTRGSALILPDRSDPAPSFAALGFVFGRRSLLVRRGGLCCSEDDSECLARGLALDERIVLLPSRGCDLLLPVELLASRCALLGLALTGLPWAHASCRVLCFLGAARSGVTYSGVEWTYQSSTIHFLG